MRNETAPKINFFSMLYRPEKIYQLLAASAFLLKEDGYSKEAESCLEMANRIHDESGCHEGSNCKPITFEQGARFYAKFNA